MSATEAQPASPPAASDEIDLDRVVPRPFWKRPKVIERAMPWMVITGFILVWELICLIFPIKTFILPAPHVIVQSMITWWPQILENSGQTLFTTVVGFLIAVAFGLAGGVVIGSSTLIYNGFYPLLIGFNAIPKVAIVPILVLWFGIGTVPAIITAFIISFFPILVNVATGIATVEPELKDVLRALGASNRQIIMKVGLPRSMPYFFASLKVAITVAFVGSIMSETVAANVGIGALMMAAQGRFEVPLVFAGLIATAVMGIMLYVIAETIERRVIGWATRGINGPGSV
ncbi:ABC transporter permease [Prosthecomicrobium hirschii]|uniref:ABC transporter permease n=1 Tax=Prosthecodimorpha hirschii TaxID=665126 RepID=UPI00221EABC2|nr:ABC transporter permease [Prosthecomicrobium hirschii]MCW1841139.1 ABC transporter permease [Prosthecomicrobium hirschii]